MNVGGVKTGGIKVEDVPCGEEFGSIPTAPGDETVFPLVGGLPAVLVEDWVPTFPLALGPIGDPPADGLGPAPVEPELVPLATWPRGSPSGVVTLFSALRRLT